MRSGLVRQQESYQTRESFRRNGNAIGQQMERRDTIGRFAGVPEGSEGAHAPARQFGDLEFQRISKASHVPVAPDAEGSCNPTKPFSIYLLTGRGDLQGS